MTSRGLAAIGVLAAWGIGIALYTEREMTRSPRERLAEAALRIAPGAAYFAVEREGKHVGFASNTIDTVVAGLQVTDYFVADLDAGGVTRRASAQSVAHLSRALALRDFTIRFGADSVPVVATGRTAGDSLLELVVTVPGGRPRGDTTRVRLNGPLMLPTMVPLAVALGRRPVVGAVHRIDTFDPATMATKALKVRIVAESLFALVDSAAFDRPRRRWAGAHADTVRGWHLVAGNGDAFDSWIDEQGRLIATHGPAGFALHRTAYELAFENWRTSTARLRPNHPASGNLSTETALSAGVTLASDRVDSLTVELAGVDLSPLQLNGGAQALDGNRVTVHRDGELTLRPAFPLPPSDVVRRRFERELRAEPLLEVDHPAIVALAHRIKGQLSDPRTVVYRIAAWVHDSLAKVPTVSLPSAIATLRSRSGDCNEHTQLFVALARAAGIPARAASGIVYVDGRFYYHAWGEVLLQRWVPMDPTLGQFPADASHIRLIVGGLTMQTELARVIGRMRVRVVGPPEQVMASARRAMDEKKRRP